ncbi:copper chaperone PCu(A)C [Nocardia sp. NPDC006630]|uniref:copper chaperone PCu(A)C n=1 Tax=Nocardia sp. NPDC006630 TaxID=3157181 RepID=UPI0033B021A3
MSASVLRPLRAPRVLRRLTAVAAVSALAVFPVACSSDSGSTSTAKAADKVTMSDQWIKAADSGMSAAFGTLSNAGDNPVQLVAASSPASARVEIHEVVTDGVGGDKTMRPKEGGLTIPAHGSATLEPGAEHLMFMDLKQPLRTGSDTRITLVFSDGSTTTVTAQVRDFAGGQENYAAPTSGAESPAHGG